MLDPIVSAQLAALREEFIARTHVDAGHLQQAVLAFGSAPLKAPHATQIKRICHRLAGGLGTFGFDAASNDATAYGRTVDPDGSPDRIVQQGLTLSLRLQSLSLDDWSGGLR